MVHAQTCQEENIEISKVISKYSKKRLYQIFRERVDGNKFKAAETKKIEKDSYALLIEKDRVLFQPKGHKDCYPLVFTIEDIKKGEKSQLEFKGVFEHIRDEFFLLKFPRDEFEVEVILEPRPDYLLIDGRIKTNSERIIRAGVELDIDATGWDWYEGLRDVRKIEGQEQYYLYGRDFRVGKRGKLPFYSFGNISNKDIGLILGVNPQEPRIFEITYDAAQKRYQLFFDMATSPKTKKFPNEVTFSAFLTTLKENTGFRGSVEKYYQLFPHAAVKRVKKEGNWMPFADIGAISDAEDFHFAYHELNIHHDGTVRSRVDMNYNLLHDIYNFAYTEPWLYWVEAPKDLKRNHDTILDLVNKNLDSDNEKIRDFASAGLLSSIRLDDGKYFIRIEDAPWCYGAVYNTNTDPTIETNERCPLNRAEVELKQAMRSIKNSYFHGVYLDSMQANEVVDDYDEKRFETTEFPLTFDKEKKAPVISQFICAYHFTELIADYLHDNGKLLMGNFPAAFTFFTQHLDVPGEETGWMKEDRYEPMNDKELSMRRVLAFRKPYLFLMAVNFDKFSKEMVDRYMRRCLFYGMFPSMFSFNAQDAPYWENPAWYNRDRDLFKKYLPHIVNLSKAGWEPVTGAAADNGKIFIEQFGRSGDEIVYITCCNQTDGTQEGRIDLAKLITGKGKLQVDEPLKGRTHSVDISNSRLHLKLETDEVILLKLIRKKE